MHVRTRATTLESARQSTTTLRDLDLDEAKLRAVSLVLAPTCNVQRVSLLFFYLALLTLQTESIGRMSESVVKEVILCAPRCTCRVSKVFQKTPFYLA